MNGKVKILFFCMIFVAGRAFCQNMAQSGYNFDPLRFYKKAQLKTVRYANPALPIIENKKTTGTFRIDNNINQYNIIPSNYYAANFGFFCKKELQLEKLTAIPFKFRLGSVQQCDRLEGKNTSLTFW